MEVHAPHHPLNTWRDFLIHIVTITIGLLIALGLEGAVEALHHRHERLETRENLKAEIEEDQKQLPHNLSSLEGERRELLGNIALLRQLRAHQPVAPGAKLDFSWDWSSMPDAAWKTARETGMLALFSSDAVQGYSGLYGQQTLVNEAGIALTRGITDSQIPLRIEPDVNALPPGLIDELIRSCAANLNQIDYTESLAANLGSYYKEALEKL